MPLFLSESDTLATLPRRYQTVYGLLPDGYEFKTRSRFHPGDTLDLHVNKGAAFLTLFQLIVESSNESPRYSLSVYGARGLTPTVGANLPLTVLHQRRDVAQAMLNLVPMSPNRPLRLDIQAWNGLLQWFFYIGETEMFLTSSSVISLWRVTMATTSPVAKNPRPVRPLRTQPLRPSIQLSTLARVSPTIERPVYDQHFNPDTKINPHRGLTIEDL